MSITQNYNSDRFQSTKDPHKFDKLVEIESQIDALVDELVAVKAEILKAICKVKDYRTREILRRHYVDMQTFERIAYNMDCSWRQTMRLHKKGLLEIEVIINEKE